VYISDQELESLIHHSQSDQHRQRQAFRRQGERKSRSSSSRSGGRSAGMG
jgi:hypothetical protein